ncbi:response regulator [Paraglaciecola sp. L1A13]|uniref:response regulator n=1 Tax=Paraglaciecola sp. L1A13 TaxID=2686359 RepID=UPI00131C9404|nr:response regulator [Paraglaciecola sp. L1A13]
MKRVNVLIVDDSELDRYILKRQLKTLGVESIFEKDDGATALVFLQDYENNRKRYPDDFPPVIIFLDINMPIVNGFDFLEEFSKIRTHLELSACVVTMYSSSERAEDKARAFKYDFVRGFLVKGELTIDFLKETIEALR